MNRRDFVKRASLVPAVGIGLRLVGVGSVGAALEVLTGCPTQEQWINAVNTILAEAGPAIQIVVTLLPLLSKQGVVMPDNLPAEISVWSQKAQADVQQLITIINQAKDDIKTNTTVQAQINALIQTTQQDLSSVLTMINVINPVTQQKITAMVTTISAAIISVENIINGVTGKLSAATMKSVKATFIPDGKAFKITFNVVLHNPTGNGKVDSATAQLSLN